VANNILRDLASSVVREGNLALRLTASIGVISRVPDGELTREALLKMADEQLYEAKANGRNRVEANLKSA
jgi:diguanylate cyclase (GGDEF)-like protein